MGPTGHNSILLAETVGTATHVSVDGEVRAVVRYRAGVTAGWIAKLVRANPNPENAFYHKKFRKPVLIEGDKDRGHNVFELHEGVYEAEHDCNGVPFRTMFEVRGSAIAWVTSVTLQKKQAMLRARQALGVL